MEVEISRKSLDCSRYWAVALVTDNPHVVHLDVEGHAPNWARVDYPYHFLCHNRPGSELCEDAKQSQ